MRVIVTECCFISWEMLRGNRSSQKKKFICSFGTTVRCLAFAVRGYMVSCALRFPSASASVFPACTGVIDSSRSPNDKFSQTITHLTAELQRTALRTLSHSSTKRCLLRVSPNDPECNTSCVASRLSLSHFCKLWRWYSDRRNRL